MTYSLFPSMGSSSSKKFPVITIVFSLIFSANDFVLSLKIILSVSVHMCVTGVLEARRWHWITWNQSYREGAVCCPKQVLGTKSGSSPRAATVEPSLQPHTAGFCLFLCCFCCLSLCLLPTFWIHFYSLLLIFEYGPQFFIILHPQKRFYSEYCK